MSKGKKMDNNSNQIYSLDKETDINNKTVKEFASNNDIKTEEISFDKTFTTTDLNISRISKSATDAEKGIFLSVNKLNKDIWEGSSITYKQYDDNSFAIYKDDIIIGFTDNLGMEKILGSLQSSDSITEKNEDISSSKVITTSDLDISRISKSATDAEKGIFLNVNKLNKDIWKDIPITYKQYGDNSFAIYKDDDIIGFTDRLGMERVLDNLDDSSNVGYSSSSRIFDDDLSESNDSYNVTSKFTAWGQVNQFYDKEGNHVRETTRNKQGRIIDEKIFSNNRLVEHAEYGYNMESNLELNDVRVTKFDEHQNKVEEAIYNIDEDGNRILKESCVNSYDKYRTLTGKTFYSQNDDGNVVKKYFENYTYDKHQNVIEINRDNYDDSGKNIVNHTNIGYIYNSLLVGDYYKGLNHVTVTDKNKKLSEDIYNKLDHWHSDFYDNGNKKYDAHYNWDDKIGIDKLIKENFYYDDKKIQKEVFYDGVGGRKEINYDKNENKTNETSYYYDDRIKEEYRYKDNKFLESTRYYENRNMEFHCSYNEDGTPKKIDYYDEDGTLKNYALFIYDNYDGSRIINRYDASGNVLSSVVDNSFDKYNF